MRFTYITVLATLFVSALGAAIPSPAEPAGIAIAREAEADGGYGTDGRGGYNKRAELPGTDGRGGYNKRAELPGTDGRGDVGDITSVPNYLAPTDAEDTT
ncbi:hypothetical protein DL95DRAFT_385724, partial [Leptodontidium sp. 2 PMI_412]